MQHSQLTSPPSIPSGPGCVFWGSSRPCLLVVYPVLVPVDNSSSLQTPFLCLSDALSSLLFITPSQPISWDPSPASFVVLLRASGPPPCSLRMAGMNAPPTHKPLLSSKAKHPVGDWTVPPCCLADTSNKIFPKGMPILCCPNPLSHLSCFIEWHQLHAPTQLCIEMPGISVTSISFSLQQPFRQSHTFCFPSTNTWSGVLTPLLG